LIQHHSRTFIGRTRSRSGSCRFLWRLHDLIGVTSLARPHWRNVPAGSNALRTVLPHVVASAAFALRDRSDPRRLVVGRDYATFTLRNALSRSASPLRKGRA